MGPRALSFMALLVTLLLLSPNAAAQHLNWDSEFQGDATCLYGEITVLATYPAVYYCGANWHPGEPAGGYCGIQDNSLTERRTIFSIWDTTADLHSQVVQADARTVATRFTNEGSGAHTHMLWNWRVGQTFQFFLQKLTRNGITDTMCYAYSPDLRRWLPSAAIRNPNGGKDSVGTFAGLSSFLENFGGKDRDAPKLALYRLWIGPSADNMVCLTRATGDGTWGELADAYFLAEGDPARLNAVFAAAQRTYGKPVLGGKGSDLEPISDRPLPPEMVKAFESLPGVMEVVKSQQQKLLERAQARAKAGNTAPPADASSIFDGIEQLDLRNAAPGLIKKLSPDFKPILVTDGANAGQTLLGVAHYGQGKVVFAAHSDLIDQGDLMPGCLRWFNVQEGCTMWILGTNGSPHLGGPQSDYQGSIHLRQLDPRQPANWKPGDVLWIEAGHIGSGLSDEELQSVQAFVHNGGCLITAAAPWVWVAYDKVPADKVSDAWMNRLVRPFGAEYANGNAQWPAGSAASVQDEDGKQVKSVTRR